MTKRPRKTTTAATGGPATTTTPLELATLAIRMRQPATDAGAEAALAFLDRCALVLKRAGDVAEQREKHVVAQAAKAEAMGFDAYAKDKWTLAEVLDKLDLGPLKVDPALVRDLGLRTVPARRVKGKVRGKPKVRGRHLFRAFVESHNRRLERRAEELEKQGSQGRLVALHLREQFMPKLDEINEPLSPIWVEHVAPAFARWREETAKANQAAAGRQEGAGNLNKRSDKFFTSTEQKNIVR